MSDSRKVVGSMFGWFGLREVDRPMIGPFTEICPRRWLPEAGNSKNGGENVQAIVLRLENEAIHVGAPWAVPPSGSAPAPREPVHFFSCHCGSSVLRFNYGLPGRRHHRRQCVASPARSQSAGTRNARHRQHRSVLAKRWTLTEPTLAGETAAVYGDAEAQQRLPLMRQLLHDDAVTNRDDARVVPV
jgi:hypothetical protein